MIVLGVDTATSQVGAALGDHDGIIASFHCSKGRRHAETLVPAIEFLCRQSQVELSRVGTVAVDIGPGLFTGLRVGVSTAKAIAQALSVPAVGFTSLDLLAVSVGHCGRLVVPMLDAKRGEVFCALYKHAPGGVQRISSYQVCSPESLRSELVARAEECLLVGDGALRYSYLFAGESQIEIGSAGHAYPSASVLVELAHPRAVREQSVRAADIQPLYLRRSDAELNWGHRREHGLG